jgi:hypothetical protein
MGFEPNVAASRVETVNEFVDCMKGTVEEAKAALTKAKEDMASVSLTTQTHDITTTHTPTCAPTRAHAHSPTATTKDM